MPVIPQTILDGQHSDIVLARMLAHTSLQGLRTDPGSKVHKLQAPTSLEVAALYFELQRVLEMTSVSGAVGHRATAAWLDQFIGERTPLVRIAATKAQVPVRFAGANGTVIPVGRVLATAGNAPVLFALDAQVTIGGTGLADGTATAAVAGTTGNLASATPLTLSIPVAGVTSVTTPGTPVVLAVDTEDDTAFIGRFMEFVHDPPNGTNPAQYRTWAREVAGVGAAAVLRPGQTNGPTGGRLDVYVVDNNMVPASQAIVDAVQAYIAPPRKVTIEAELFTVGTANGVTTDNTQIDDSGSSIKMVYDAANYGEVTYVINPALVQAGQWTVRPKIKVNSAAGATGLLRIWVEDVTAAATAQTRQTGGVPADFTYPASAFGLAFANTPTIEFWWGGSNTYRLHIRRLQTDTTTQVWVDNVLLQSEFSSYDLEGKANAAGIVQVLPALPVSIAVVAPVKVAPGYVQADVLAAVSTAITAYLKGIALRPDDLGGNDVIYGALGAAIQSVPGVLYYDPATFRVNTATANVAIALREVAVPGAYTVTALP